MSGRRSLRNWTFTSWNNIHTIGFFWEDPRFELSNKIHKFARKNALNSTLCLVSHKIISRSVIFKLDLFNVFESFFLAFVFVCACVVCVSYVCVC